MLRFLKNSGIFLIGSILSRLITFLLLPVYTRYIPTRDFGYFDASLVLMTVVTESVFLNIWVVLLRRLKDENGRGMGEVYPGIVLFGLSTLVYLGLGVVGWLVFDFRYYWLIIAFGFVQALSYVYKHIARGLGRNIDFAISGIIAALTTLASNLLFLVVFRWDFGSLYVASILALLADTLYLELRIGIARQIIAARVRRHLWRAVYWLARLALPVGLNAIVYWLVNSVNRIVIIQVLGEEANGEFAVAFRFGAIISLVIMALTYAWQDIAFGKSARDGVFFGKAAGGYAGALLFGLALLLPAVSILFPLAVDAAYGGAYVVTPLTLAVATISGYSNFLVNIFYAIEQNKQTLWAILIAGVTNTVLAFPLVMFLGLQGASLSSFIGYLAGIGYMLWRLEREIGMRVSLLWPLVGIGISAVSAAVFFWANPWANGATAALLLVVGAVAGLRVRRLQREPKPRRALVEPAWDWEPIGVAGSRPRRRLESRR